jgi:hypothetical protein
MIAIISTDGQLNLDEIENECVKQKWIPLVVLKNKKDNSITLPIFNLADVARKFIVRNMPKNWKQGCVLLTETDLEIIKSKKWNVEILDFPRKVNEHPDFDMTFEIHEFSEEPDFKCA